MNFENTLTIPCETSRGSSEAADYIEEQREEWQNIIEESFYLGLDLKYLIDELYTIVEECKKKGWDGYEADPISERTFINSYNFIKSIPFGIEAPTVSVEPDGHIVFEWYHTQTRLLSVSIGLNGLLHYAALLGPRKYFGTDPFLNFIPNSIINLILQVKDV